MGRGPPRRLHGTERRRAKNVTQSVVWSTRGPKVRENVIDFEQSEKEQKDTQTGREIHYAQQHLLTKNASEYVLAQPDRCHFVMFPKTMPSDVKMKMLKKYWKYV